MNNLNNELALQRTKLSNQRTYLSYMQAGLAIAAIAGTFKKKWIALFGVLMVIGSTIQYIVLNNMIQKKEYIHHVVPSFFYNYRSSIL